jgi:hypothetical protein
MKVPMPERVSCLNQARQMLADLCSQWKFRRMKAAFQAPQKAFKSKKTAITEELVAILV